MAEEWVNDVGNEVRVEANLHAKANRALGVSKQKNKELASKLVAKERAHLSAEADLKNIKNQAKDQHKKLHLIEIELATQKQLVLDLKAELQKAKEVAQVAKEVSEVAETASCVGCRKRRYGWQISRQRCAGTTAKRYEQKRSTGQESLLPPNGGALRTYSI